MQHKTLLILTLLLTQSICFSQMHKNLQEIVLLRKMQSLKYLDENLGNTNAFLVTSVNKLHLLPDNKIVELRPNLPPISRA